MSLKRLFQVVAKEELQAGSAAATLYAAANAAFLVIDPMVEFAPEQFDRANINRASMSPFSPLAGVVTGKCTFQLELSGTGSATIPGWSTLLQACGMREVPTVAITIGAVSVGSPLAFYNGETITGSVAGAGTVIHDTYNGDTILLMEVTTPFVDTEVITGTTSLSVATASTAPWAYGTSWVPDSIELLYLDFTTDTGTNEIGDVIIGQTSGAIAILQATPIAANVSVRVLDGIFTDGEDAWNVTQGSGAANMLATIIAATTVQTNVPALSMAVIEDGPAKALLGCRGTFALSGNIGEAMLFNFDFTGLKNAVTDEGTVTGITYTSQVPPVMLGVSFDIWDDTRADATTYSPRFSSLSFDYANTLGIGRDAGESTGVYGSAHITSRNTSGNLTIDVAPEGAFAFIEAVTAGTPTHMKLAIGSTDGNKFKMSTPSAVFTGEGGGDNEGIATRDLPFRVGSRHPDGTDSDDCELILTYIADSTAP